MLSELPSLTEIIELLSSEPAAPASLNLLHVLLVPFLPSPSTAPSSSPASSSAPSAFSPSSLTWQDVYDHYEPGTQAHHFILSDQSAESSAAVSQSATILLRPPSSPETHSPRTHHKLHLAFSHPSPSPSRTQLFSQILAHLSSLLSHFPSYAPEREVYVAGLPEGLWPTWTTALEAEGVTGRSRSWRVSKRLEDVLAGTGRKGGRVLKGLEEVGKNTVGRQGSGLVASGVQEEEVQELLTIAGRTSPPSSFYPLLHLCPSIHLASLDLAPPEGGEPTGPILTWHLVYDDLSIAVLHTLPAFRGSSLASHLLPSFASNLAHAFDGLPAELRKALGEGELSGGTGGEGKQKMRRWVTADWDDGNPMGSRFFANEGFTLEAEGVRWAKGFLK